MSEIAINLVFEDYLSGAVLRKLLANSKRNYMIGFSRNSGGFGWIRKRIEGFNNAAQGMTYLILTDLDKAECPPELIREWHIENRNHNLLFNIAVRQVESWILGCRGRFAKFLGIKEDSIPSNVDDIPDAKRFLIDLARQSGKRDLRVDIVPAEGSTAKVGPDYNGRLMYFVENLWDPDIAKESSASLRRAMDTLDVFEPVFEDMP